MAKIDELLAEMEKAAEDSKAWETWHAARAGQEALLEFPMGELSNPGIQGFLWTWKSQGKLAISGITNADRFAANGLEGKASVRTGLVTALLAYRELPEYRRAIQLLGGGGWSR